MFYYDEDGEMQTTTDADKKWRKHVTTMLRTNSYNLKASAAGRLSEVLGEVDPNVGRREATRRVRRALEEIGLEALPIDVAVEALDDAWKAKIQVG